MKTTPRGFVDVAVVLAVLGVTALLAWLGPGGVRDEQREHWKQEWLDHRLCTYPPCCAASSTTTPPPAAECRPHHHEGDKP